MTKLKFIILLSTLYSCQASNTASQSSNENTTSNVQDTIIDSHNSKNSLDWNGVYQGIIPCADCPGIKTTITLHRDSSFLYTAEYLESKTILEDHGKFTWLNDGSAVHLKGKTVDTKYQVGENVLVQMDQDGKMISGAHSNLYNLQKVD